MSTVEETTPRAPEGETTVLPLLPLRGTVVFPASLTPLAIGQERSIRLVDEAVAGDQTIAVVASRAGEEEERSPEDLYEVGTSAVVHKMVRVPDGTLRVLVQGLERVRLDGLEQT
ncbi:MAG: LON peptidase substrate-binding domain-containing protein, partial [Gaiellaceae bacterium]